MNTRHTLLLDLLVEVPPEIPAMQRLPFLFDRLMDEILGTFERKRNAPGIEIQVILTDDREIQKINREHRRKDAPTDVLSFPSYDFEGPGILSGGGFPGDPEDPFALEGRVLVGDLVISLETCRRQAAEIGHPVQDEFLRLLVHGLLHLFGYDHERSVEEEERMRAEEDHLLDFLDGLGI